MYISSPLTSGFQITWTVYNHFRWQGISSPNFDPALNLREKILLLKVQFILHLPRQLACLYLFNIGIAHISKAHFLPFDCVFFSDFFVKVKKVKETHFTVTCNSMVHLYTGRDIFKSTCEFTGNLLFENLIAMFLTTFQQLKRSMICSSLHFAEYEFKSHGLQLWWIGITTLVVVPKCSNLLTSGNFVFSSCHGVHRNFWQNYFLLSLN